MSMSMWASTSAEESNPAWLATQLGFISSSKPLLRLTRLQCTVEASFATIHRLQCIVEALFATITLLHIAEA